MSALEAMRDRRSWSKVTDVAPTGPELEAFVAAAGRVADHKTLRPWRIIEIRALDDHHHFTLMCADFAQLGQLVQLDNAVFRAVKAATPGRYTFILPATREVPRRVLHPKKKTVGVRIPDHPFCRALLAAMGEPLLTSSLLLPGDEEPLVFGWEVKERLDHVVDVVVDGDQTGCEPTTVVDLSSGYAEVVRVGSGDPSPFR